MELAEPTVTKHGSQLHVSHGEDKGLFVQFYTRAVEHPYQSEQAGRPVYVDQDYILILFPGDNTKKVDRPVDKGDLQRPSDAKRWPEQWAAYKAQQEVVQVGTPLTEWPPLSKAVALTLKGLNIHTVEQLAEVPDTALTWLGAREQHEKAKVWLAQASNGAEAMRLKAENDKLRTDIDQLKAQFAELFAQRKGKQP